MREHGVAVVPGSYCSAAPLESEAQCPYIRLSFVLEEDQFPEAMLRLGRLTRACP